MRQTAGKRKVAMKILRHIACLLLVTLAGPVTPDLTAQDKVHHLVDKVELPAALDREGRSACFLAFREQWTFLPKGALAKEVSGFELSCSGERSELALPEGSTRIRELSHEFMLLDPHLVESNNRAFPEPDSLDLPTRRLQADLIELIRENSPVLSRYDPSMQLLSVIFHEEWTVDSYTGVIEKKVKAITPVIWQRRQTAEGDGVDDVDTGLPVYYKNPLEKIYLRLP